MDMQCRIVKSLCLKFFIIKCGERKDFNRSKLCQPSSHGHITLAIFRCLSHWYLLQRDKFETQLNFNLKNSKPGIEITWRCKWLMLTSEVLRDHRNPDVEAKPLSGWPLTCSRQLRKPPHCCCSWEAGARPKQRLFSSPDPLCGIPW